MQNIIVSRWLFPLPAVTFVIGLLLTWSEFEGLAAGLIIAGLLHFVAQAFLLSCSSCGKSPYVRHHGGRSKYSAPMPEGACSKCGMTFETVPAPQS